MADKPSSLDATVICSLIDFQLAISERLDEDAKVQTDRTPGNLYDVDRAWSQRVGGQDSILPALVALGYLTAAQQHLRGIRALLPLEGVDASLNDAARACCEASARLVAVLDPRESPLERVTRALNDCLHMAPGQLRSSPGAARTSLTETAHRLRVHAELDQSGRTLYFGSRQRPNMTKLTGRYLANLNVPTPAFDVLWRLWNGSAHGSLDAGLTLGLGGDSQVHRDLRTTAALTALTAFVTAQDGWWAYQGKPRMAEFLAAHLRDEAVEAGEP